MSPEKKTHLLDIFQQCSLYLGLFALVPYSFGDLSNALPPEVKKYTALASLALAGATRLTASAIQFLSAVPASPEKPATDPQTGEAENQGYPDHPAYQPYHPSPVSANPPAAPSTPTTPHP